MVHPTLSLGPTLETERLFLRPPAAEDLAPFSAMMADPECTRYLGGAMGRQASWRAWSAIIGAWVVNGFSLFSLIDKSSGRWIGRVGPWRPADWPGPEIGWALVREAWGKGYASEAATCVLDWAFDTLGWTEAVHCIHPDNANSIALARRLGSRWLRSGTFPPPMEYLPTEIYGQSREEWRARHPRGGLAAPRSFAITAIDHVQITVPPELESEAKGFYGELLGLGEIDKPAELKARGGAWYQLGNAQLHIALDSGADGSASRRHVCLAVDELGAARAFLLARGVAVTDEPIQTDGLERFFIRDPAGNRVEIGRRR